MSEDGFVSTRDSAARSSVLSPSLVKRSRLIRKLRVSTAPVVLLNAPSGYGKSVLIEQWAGEDPRSFTSVVLDERHNDPGFLVASVIAALGAVEPVPAAVSAALQGPEPSFENVVLPRLGEALADRAVPEVLVLDDLESIESPQSLQIVSMIGERLPKGSRLVLASRTEPALPIGRLRAHRHLIEFGRADLVMNKAECRDLLGGLGLVLTSQQLDALVNHTEGWPAALYLAGLALGEEPDLGGAIARFAGDDRIVVDYIRDEFLGSLSKRRLEFLREVSILDRLSGDLCDAVLERTGSARTIRDLSRSNMLLTPLDRRDEWFRLHALFREMLRSELRRVEPAKEAELHRRACEWWAERSDWDRAIHHAIESGASDRAGELLWLGVPDYLARGRNATVIGWLERLGEDTVATDAALSLTAAYAEITRGAGPPAEHWAAVARSQLGAVAVGQDRDALLSGLALVEAALARDGVAAMGANSAGAAQLLPEESPWLSMCFLLDGVGLHLRGFGERAQERLAEGARRGSVGAPSIQVLSLSQLALLAVEEGDWQLAEALASQARAQLNRSGLIEYPMMALPVAVSAHVRAHAGLVERATADLRLGTDLLGQLDQFAPWYEVETRVVLAGSAIRLGDAAGATSLIGEASRSMKFVPDAIVLERWIAEAAAAAEHLSTAEVSGLTPAELRILQFLPTHLSFPQIAAQIIVSPNTVKTQAQGVYRKLGVSSRREAVEIARKAGLLDEESRGQPT